MAVRYRFVEPEGVERRVMFNFNGHCKVFSTARRPSRARRPLGAVLPQMPERQFADIVLGKGVHEVVGLIRKPAEEAGLLDLRRRRRKPPSSGWRSNTNVKSGEAA
jgi:hypothetical protein